MTKKKPEIDKSIVIVAIGGIVVLDGIALFLGHNGLILSTSIAAIAGLAGLSLPQVKFGSIIPGRLK